ncbi:MAG: 16S rRNA (adenine(1518)-N(6)/adenine(1519)-N(6))-dimethyltransferase RsmA [Tepidanaerobacteraceae bacterium]|jgi:16S rRNA (adenine1518-N6/adenine1519-N6)-dimethyltransferase|nr:16S rRNA (adenine(1518)-N(6)/adenine(1519)-N(6))-dimethyltransferase RsmA [Tepidanaerobacteraceae bacterium]
MRRYNLRPNKRLGQHFLVDSRPLYAMLQAAELLPEDGVLEIGPGLGVLTRELCSRAGKVVAVEKDRQLIPILEDLTKDFKNICILDADVLKLDMEELREEHFGGSFKVVANLPYYITSPIIMKIIENRHLIPLAVLMVQKEVAQRLVASPGSKDYGILTIAVNMYAEVKLVCNVGKSSFLPPPKVESAVVKILLRQKPRVEVDEELFFKVVEAAFGERRKTLKNSLSRRLDIPGIDPEVIAKALEVTGIDPMRRGETLSIEEYAQLLEALKKYAGET